MAPLMKVICNAGARCACAYGNHQWRDQSCEVAERHAELLVDAGACVVRHILNPVVPPGGLDNPQYLEAFRRCSTALEANGGALQDDLRDMLIALGLPDHARPQSPHEVFRKCIDEVKRLRAKQSVRS